MTTADLIAHLNLKLSLEDIRALSDADLEKLKNLLFHWHDLAAGESRARRDKAEK